MSVPGALDEFLNKKRHSSVDGSVESEEEEFAKDEDDGGVVDGGMSWLAGVRPKESRSDSVAQHHRP